MPITVTTLRGGRVIPTVPVATVRAGIPLDPVDLKWFAAGNLEDEPHTRVLPATSVAGSTGPRL
jgi:hypothetical protein